MSEFEVQVDVVLARVAGILTARNWRMVSIGKINAILPENSKY